MKGPLLLLMEHCTNGDLHTFLRSRKHLLHQWKHKEDVSSGNMCLMDSMEMAINISDGMCFLSSHGVVHKNLSARSILLDHNNQVKIADYGKAKYLSNHKDVHKTEVGDLISVRWQAPECIQFERFTSSSDVWAFGVLLWELFTLGGEPYPGIVCHDLLAYLRTGERLNYPNSCPEEVYNLMLTCWCMTPTERPCFLYLVRMLQDIVQREIESQLPNTTSF